MSDNPASSTSKSSKKNRKKHAKKQAQSQDDVAHGAEDMESTSHDHEPRPLDPIEELKQKIEEAKAVKDHKLAQLLRQELWSLQDKVAKGMVSLSMKVTPPSTRQQTPPANPHPPPPPSSMSVSKTMKKLQKKLQAIEELKKRRDDGDKLEENQLAKIASEGELRAEIKMLEDSEAQL